MRFEQLLELFGKIEQKDGEWSQQDEQDQTNVFFVKKIRGKTGDHTYTYHAKLTGDETNRDALINFWMDEGTTELTGESNAAEVLNNAIYFIKEIANKHNPITITFHALKKVGGDEKESGSRGDVYAKLLRRFATQNGYEPLKSDTQGQDTFILKKINKKI
ncbi:MAG: hypothetical protein EBR82_12480 [Caulobacteraceae bacterium]|nr:hypothetical protein [Caulobacteraceae bacterium]